MQSQRKIVYSIPVTQPLAGESSIFRQECFKDGCVSVLEQGEDTMQKLLLKSFKKHSTNKCLGTLDQKTNEYSYITYQEVEKITMSIGSALMKLNFIEEITDQQGFTIKPIGIYSKNRAEWSLVDMACILYGFTSVTFYDTLGPQSTTYIKELVNLKILFCSAETAHTLSKIDLSGIEMIVCFDDLENFKKYDIQNKQIKILTFDEFIEIGKQNLLEMPKVLPTTSLTLCFTSGTTGDPKGALHPHSTFVSLIALQQFLGEAQIKPEDVHLSYLPLPHLYERARILTVFFFGCTVCYYSGNILKLSEDLQKAKPTLFCSVPRIYNRFYERIQNLIESLPEQKKAQFNEAVEIKLRILHTTGKTTHEEFDGTIFAQTKMILGGRQRLCFTGAAPISPKILDFMKVVLCCPIIEGYGQTESTAFSFLTVFNDPTSGYVGGPQSMNELKIVDVPEMGYLSTDLNEDGILTPRGEVCLRGPGIIPGYFKSKEKTLEVLDPDGWLHTGDIGTVLPNGALKIIDRKKNLFKLSQGEYVSPEKIENIYLRCSRILEVLIYGDSLRDYTIAIVVPEPNHLLQLGEQLGLYENLHVNDEIKRIYLEYLQRQGESEGLFSFEQAKRIYLETNSFSQRGLLTETSKMQRHKAKIFYQEIIKKLYE